MTQLPFPAKHHPVQNKQQDTHTHTSMSKLDGSILIAPGLMCLSLIQEDINPEVWPMKEAGELRQLTLYRLVSKILVPFSTRDNVL